MATYTVTTDQGEKVIKTKRDLSEDEVKAQLGKRGLNVIEVQKPGFKVPGPIKKAADIITTPSRGLRGVGVGAQRLMEGTGEELFDNGPLAALRRAKENLPGAVERAAEAVKPGFEAVEGERVGAIGGDVVGSLPLALTTGGSGLAVGLAQKGKLTFQIIRSGLSSGAMTAISQASEEERIIPGQIAKASAFGAAIPMIKPSAEIIRTFVGKKVLPSLLNTTARVPEQAVRDLIDDPALFKKYKGVESEIESKVTKVQEALMESRNRAGKVIDNAKKRLGIDIKLIDKQKKLAEAGTLGRGARDVMDDFVKFKEGVGAQPKTAKNTIKKLISLRDEIDNLVDFKPGVTVPKVQGQEAAVLKRTAKELNDMLDNIPEAQMLRKAERGYSNVSEVYDQLQKDLADAGTAEDMLERVYKGKNTFDVTGKTKLKLKLLEQVDKLSQKMGKGKVVEPLFKSFSSQAFKRFFPRVGLGTPLGLAGSIGVGLTSAPAGVALGAFLLSPKLAGFGIRGAQTAVKGATTPAARAMLQSVTAKQNR